MNLPRISSSNQETGAHKIPYSMLRGNVFERLTAIAPKPPTSKTSKKSIVAAKPKALPPLEKRPKTRPLKAKRAKILTWEEDFKAKPWEGSWFHAWSAWCVTYNYRIIEDNGTYVKLKPTTKATFSSNRAWRRKECENDDLLWHEQGHFDIAYISSLDLKKRMATMKFSSSNYQQEIKDLYK